LRNDKVLAATLFVWPLIGNALLNFPANDNDALSQQSALGRRDQTLSGLILSIWLLHRDIRVLFSN